MPAADREPPSPPDEDERDRRAANRFMLVGALVIIGLGVWLVDALIAARRADECLSAGRRHCSPVELPARR